MPTVTQPKRQPDPYAIPIEIKPVDRIRVAECIGLHHKKDDAELKEFIQRLEKLLTILFNRIRKVCAAPLPAHILAELGPILKNAEILAKCLNAADMPVSVLRELNVPEVDDGTAWQLLTKIHLAAALAVDRLRRSNSSGLHVKVFSEQLDLALVAMGELFPRLEGDASADELAEWQASRSEFLAICRQYLPKAPTARKRSKASPFPT